MAALRSAAFAARRAAACPAVRRPQPVFAAAKTSPAAAQWRLFSAGAAREFLWVAQHDRARYGQLGGAVLIGVASSAGEEIY